MNYDELKANFLATLKHGVPGAQREWMGTVIDYAECQLLNILCTSPGAPRKLKDFESVFADSLDYAEGPTHADIIQLLSAAMNSTDPQINYAANNLARRCAHVWAKMNEDEE